MKILIITQKIDLNDPVLGFFHRWVEEFAKNYEFVTVICLGKGEYNLPKNVKVLSLGKERKLGSLFYLWNFYKYLWQERRNYETVFVHMNQEYVLLAGLWWRLTNKKILLWRNHPMGSWLTRLSVILANRVFCTSPQSFTAQFKKTKLMPAGIDTEMFRPMPEIKKILNSILFFGRMSPIKRPHLLLEALADLNKKGLDFIADFIGDSGESREEREYYDNLKKIVKERDLEEKVFFYPGVSHDKAPIIFNQHEIYVNLTPTGSFDKTILEAMSCDITPVVCNESLRGFLDTKYLLGELDSESVAINLQNILSQKKEVFRSCVKESHSLSLLIEKVLK
jgi:glycosyltransferase involved in cell wall biosynthesis